ncbi:hypothetical protein CXF68_11300 [Tenacibaculum sp. Bg11-29]|uniref:hypothetical protein n=1 Tax=Tenacibaculum sp. Bg11-29 TaxID=2058306 RepID=UPI000C32B123|nr:hypothetical protein [Tenacibaculum sp. Bg11-29]PKH51230.1 hypothetical protein CXF68_11300 [Tenacibaculum sp. Bg11-29]
MKLESKEFSESNEFRNSMELIIGDYLEGLNSQNKGDKQKQLELCQVGKMLVTYFPEFKIKEMREVPDFIISNNELTVGLEHEVVSNFELRRKHGFFENLFRLAERDLLKSNDTPNLLLNCFLYQDLEFPAESKAELIENIKEVLNHYFKYNEIIDNGLIKDIFKQPHNTLSLAPNFGAHMVSDITEGIIQEAINKKEKKIENYRRKTELPQWLLIVAGGVSEYSYDIEEYFLKDFRIKSTFDKVLLMSDFKNKLYELETVKVFL